MGDLGETCVPKRRVARRRVIRVVAGWGVGETRDATIL